MGDVVRIDEARRHEGFDGEFSEDNFRLLLSLLQDAKTAERKLEDELRGKRLKIAKLEKDREREALEAPERERVDVLHRCWQKACKRRRALGYDDRELGNRSVKTLGFSKCLTAIAGAAHDPGTRRLRNGRLERFDDWELVFRNYGKTKDFARRAPLRWKPNPEQVAEIGGVSVEKVRAWIG